MTSVVHEDDDFVPSFSEAVASYADLGSAEAVVGILRGESVHAKVKPVRSPNGPPTAYPVFVDPRQLHRARWILQDPDLTDAELTYLAIGKLGDETESES